MTEEINQETLFWEAIEAMKNAIELGELNLDKDMPLFQESITDNVQQKLKNNLDTISQNYSKQASEIINQKIKEDIARDNDAVNENAKNINKVLRGIEEVNSRMNRIEHEQKKIKVNDWGMKLIIAVGFISVSLASISILVMTLNILTSVGLKAIWDIPMLGTTKANISSWQGIISLIAKILLSVGFLGVGTYLVSCPYQIFQLVLSKMPFGLVNKYFQVR
ncbi:MAG: hypothetical protein WAW70_08485 [Streptococcus parauberis]